MDSLLPLIDEEDERYPLGPALFFLTIDIAAIICAVLLGSRILAEFPRRANAYLAALILANTIAHVVLSRAEYTYWIPEVFHFEIGPFRPLLNLLRNSTPGLFMILAHRLFVDGQIIPRWLLGIFALQMVLEEPAGWLFTLGTPSSIMLEESFPALLQICLVGAALYWCFAHWRSDLINSRRRTRAAITLIIGVQLIAPSLLLRVIIDQSTVTSYYVHVATVATGCAICIFMIMRISPQWICEHLMLDRNPVVRSRPAQDSKSQSTEVLNRLMHLLKEEKIYREHGLNLAELAEKLQLPEYRLRTLIHEQLGYRNFNALLHAYRIREACDWLSDPAQFRTPITTIALSVGYTALNTFNRGFREVMEMTPTEYKDKYLSSKQLRNDSEG